MSILNNAQATIVLALYDSTIERATVTFKGGVSAKMMPNQILRISKGNLSGETYFTKRQFVNVYFPDAGTHPDSYLGITLNFN